MDACCVCGKPLPNRYSISGRCAEPGCGKPFCSLHWFRGNRRCPEHGFEGQDREAAVARPAAAAPEAPAPAAASAEPARPAPTAAVPDPAMVTPVAGAEPAAAAQPPSRAQRLRVSAEKAKVVVAGVLAFAGMLGGRAAELLKKLKKDDSPEALLATLDEAREGNRQRAEELAKRTEELYVEITAKKKAYESAPPARREILELQLKRLLAEHRVAKNEYAKILKDEITVLEVQGRVYELAAEKSMKAVTEDLIDQVTSRVDELVEKEEDRGGAARDLEKAGRRRERESEQESFEDQLAEFGVPEATAVEEAQPAKVAEAPAPPAREGPPAPKQPEPRAREARSEAEP